jgi:hypothetical protein
LGASAPSIRPAKISSPLLPIRLDFPAGRVAIHEPHRRSLIAGEDIIKSLRK